MNADLLSKNYLHVPNFISAEHADFLYQQVLKDCEEWEPDGQCPQSPAKYKYALAEKELSDNLDKLSLLVEEPLLPTYSYSRVYGNGEELKKHIDRPACEISVSVILNKDHDWPIYIEDWDNNPQEIELEIGDALIFLGVHNEHWREKFEGNNYTAFFLHYVRENSYGARLVNDDVFVPDIKCHEGRIRSKILRNELIDLGWRCNKPKYGKTEVLVSDYIHVVHDAIDPDLCDHIVEYFDRDHKAWTPALTAGDEMDGNKKSKQRVNDILEISRLKDDAAKLIDMSLYEAVNKVSQEYAKLYDFVDVQADEGYFLLRYDVGGQYVCHADSGTRQHRELSMVALLSDPDDFEGGDLAFLYGSYIPKLKKGSIVAFPSNFVFSHRVMPVTSGTRYSLVTWFK
jgi:predicted 2-oxoglutarate/Fe(II)-dependent dioxygenase YbiX